MAQRDDIRELRAEIRRLKSRIQMRPIVTKDGVTAAAIEPYITLRVQGGNTLLEVGPVYGIKRFAGEALFDPADKPGNVRATATCTVLDGEVNAVTQGAFGEGYVLPAPVVTVGPPPTGGTQAVITATIATSSFVKFAYLTDVGSDYDAGATVTFADPDEPGTTATGTVVIRDGKVVGIVITEPGSGYTEAPAVTITPVSGGADAAATAVLAIGSIALEITTPGTGYLVAPSIRIAAPAAIPSSEEYPDGIGIAQVAAGSLYGPSLPAPAIGSQVIVVHDDRSLVAYGLMGDGPTVPFSRPPDAVATWYQTLLKIDGADTDADGILPAWVPMFGGI
jgi:hypothetical protein